MDSKFDFVMFWVNLGIIGLLIYGAVFNNGSLYFGNSRPPLGDPYEAGWEAEEEPRPYPFPY